MAFNAGVISAGIQGITSILSGKTRVQFIQNNKTVITIDASVRETHTADTEPTMFPVESGQTVSDHIIIKPQSLEIQGIISDTPIGGLQGLIQEAATTVASALLPPVGVVAASAAVSLFSALSGSTSPSVAAYGQLLQLRQNGNPFDVITTLKRYPDMWIKSISVPRDAENGRVLTFTVSLVQLLLVSPQSVSIQIFANPGLASPQSDTGRQDPSLASDAQRGYANEQSLSAGIGTH